MTLKLSKVMVWFIIIYRIEYPKNGTRILIRILITLSYVLYSLPSLKIDNFPVGIYLLQVNSRNTASRSEICSKLTTKATERLQWRGSGVVNVNFEHISHLVLVLLLLTLSR